MPGKSQEAIQKETAQCLDFILGRIYRHEIPPGSEVKQVHFQDRFTPATVKRTLRQLVYDGAATDDGLHTNVVPFDHKRQQTIIAARIVTEAYVVYSLSESGVPITEAKQINSLMEEQLNGNPSSFWPERAFRFVMLDRDFHITLGSNNPAAQRVISEGYHSLVIPLGSPLPTHDHAKDIIVEHNKLINAIEEQNKVAAMRAIYRHLSAAVGRWYAEIPEFVNTVLREIFLELGNTKVPEE